MRENASNTMMMATGTSRSTVTSSGNDSLFLATSRALAGLRPRGGLLNRLVGMFPDRVVGVFPEGTSYTEPHIIQVKEGAAWVALEYARWMRENADSDGQPIKIIPVGIAYTDKTQYLSRVSVIQQPFSLSRTFNSGGVGRSTYSKYSHDGKQPPELILRQVMENLSFWVLISKMTTTRQ
jgi:hypothetical protein